MYKNPLLDKDFLKELDKTSLKEVYAEVIALNSDDESLESIEGYITQGTITIDGNSSVRRTCSLTIVADELNIHEFYWGLHTKFKLSVGMKNTINPNYPDIIWFPQGVFVISSFNTTQNTSNYTIQVQGKDKMSLLNGELGGMITALTHNFGEYLYTNAQGYTTAQKTLIKEIIIDAVHQFANEPLYNIIINDLEDVGLELMEYRGDKPFYIIINETTQEVENMTLNGDTEYYIGVEKYKISEIPKYNPLFNLEQSGIVYDYTIVHAAANDNIPLSIAKLEYGKTAGYRITDLVYAGDLILNVGETVTSLLDKIVNMLGDFEYFYDIDGRFIFQRKKTYISTKWNNIINNSDEQYIENAAYTSAISYSFEDGGLVASYSNNPNFSNLKNDFSIWGTKKSVTGKELPVHMRYAIDKKPVLYINYNGVCYTTLSQDELLDFIEEHNYNKELFYIKKKNPVGLSEDWWDIFDWAEYYYKCNGYYPNGMMYEYLVNGGVFFGESLNEIFPRGPRTSDTYLKRKINVFDVEPDGTLGYTGHGTGCSHKYTDYFINGLQARGATAYIYKPELPVDLLIPDLPITLDNVKTNLDWRELIYQMAIDYRKNNMKDDFYNTIRKNNFDIYPNGKTKYEQYYVDMEGFWRQLYNPEYKGSYQPIFVTKEKYEADPSKYLYSVPKYKQCTPTDPYRSAIVYYSYQYDYIKDANTLQVDHTLTKYNYYGNEDKYYYIAEDEPYKIVSCIVIEPYRVSGLGYYDESYKPITTKVQQTEYQENPQKYYFVNKENYEPCARIREYDPSTLYYIINSSGAYEMVHTLIKEEYLANPSKYYYKHYNYIQCKPKEFSPSNIYYRQATASTTDNTIYVLVKVINQSIYDKNPTMYYLREENPEYKSCVEKLVEYDGNKEYYEQSKTLTEVPSIVYNKIDEIDSGNYNTFISKGNIYYKVKQFLCCRHPVEYSSLINFYEKVEDEYDGSGWVKEVSQNPESLNFWFDFLDEDSELQKYGCYAVGDRPKAVNDNQVKAIYFRETPTAIFVNNDEWDTADRSKLGYTYLKLPPSMENLFSISPQGKSTKSVLDNYIYKYACNAESITISTLPIYHLEPNTRIFVHSEESGINGEYILTRYNINLGNGNNMSINAIKAVDRLY